MYITNKTVANFIASTDKKDDYLLGSELTKNMIDSVGEERFVAGNTGKMALHKITDIADNEAFDFYLENKTLIKSWIKRLIDKERRGATDIEKLASILGFNTQASERILLILDQNNANGVQAANDDTGIVDSLNLVTTLINTLFGTISAAFRSFLKQP